MDERPSRWGVNAFAIRSNVTAANSGLVRFGERLDLRHRDRRRGLRVLLHKFGGGSR